MTFLSLYVCWLKSSVYQHRGWDSPVPHPALYIHTFLKYTAHIGWASRWPGLGGAVLLRDTGTVSRIWIPFPSCLKQMQGVWWAWFGQLHGWGSAVLQIAFKGLTFISEWNSGLIINWGLIKLFQFIHWVLVLRFCNSFGIKFNTYITKEGTWDINNYILNK